jgi:CBS domain-containing protein
MRAEKIMTRNVCVVGPEASLKEAATLLVRRHIRGLPVVDADGTLVGMITEADLLAAGSAPDPRRHARRDLPVPPEPPRTVGEAMSSPVIAARADADLADVARIMLSAHLTRVPILDDRGRLVGLVSRRDLVRLLTRPDPDIAADVRQLLTDWSAEVVPTVAVTDGEVTLSGPEAAVPDLLVALIRAVPGVIGVHAAAPNR